MALPINVEELIRSNIVESTRIEYKSDWNPEPVIHSITAFANDIDNTGGGYIILDIEEERELISLSRDVPFDDRVNLHAEVANMRSSLISEFLHSVESDLYEGSLTRTVDAVAADMQLVRGPAEYRKPVNVGLMFFNERPDTFFPYAQIEVVVKPDPTGIGMRERIFRGPLDKQLRDALEYVKNSIIEEYVTKVPDQAEAIRVFNWPYRAIEEALSNAVYHRSYQIHEPVTVTVTLEKMEILSVPGPDLSITDADLENRVLVASRYRNRRIGDFLKELKMVEGRNTGVPLIVNAMCQNGSGLPEFKTDAMRSYFRVILPIHPVFLERTKLVDKVITVQPERKRITRRTREELRQLVIVALRQDELSMREIAMQLGYTKLTDTLRSVVKELIDNNIAEYLYPGKANSSKQKIRLREKG